ncbi:hypothetical protein C8F00_0453 [Xanthomonas vasicola]
MIRATWREYSASSMLSRSFQGGFTACPLIVRKTRIRPSKRLTAFKRRYDSSSDVSNRRTRE